MTQAHQPELPFEPQINLAAMQVAAPGACTLLKSLANESRLIILCHLSQGECSVAELQTRLPLSQSALSQHLARLRRDGLVRDRRDARNVFYAMTSGPAQSLLQTIYLQFCASQA